MIYEGYRMEKNESTLSSTCRKTNGLLISLIKYILGSYIMHRGFYFI